MKESIALEAVLLQYLKCSAYRLKFVANFVLSLVRVKSVNLTQVATGLNADATTASNYRRIQRFFAGFFLKTMHSPALF